MKRTLYSGIIVFITIVLITSTSILTHINLKWVNAIIHIVCFGIATIISLFLIKEKCEISYKGIIIATGILTIISFIEAIVDNKPYGAFSIGIMSVCISIIFIMTGVCWKHNPDEGELDYMKNYIDSKSNLNIATDPDNNTTITLNNLS